ncbi:MAG TPA: DUF4276 family protein [Anaerolineae bacterium]|nr:DUF4276 family protein [Anaerolineae bacterium]
MGLRRMSRAARSRVHSASFRSPELQLRVTEAFSAKVRMHPSRKTLHGPMIIKRIGLASIRERCPHFDAWVTMLENA